MLKLGLPKGRLLPRSEAAVAAFPAAGARPWFLRMPDIPDLVSEGLLDVGIAGEEWLVESGADVVRIAPLCWYHVRICALCRPGGASEGPVSGVPGGAGGTWAAGGPFAGLPAGGPVRLVSEYPRISRDFAAGRWGENFTQRTVRGSVEHYVPDLADVAIECVETGESMRRRGLIAVETLFEADVWLICSRAAAEDVGTVALLSRWAELIAAPAPDGPAPHARPVTAPRPTLAP